jgi:tetratricopeptide (TPR) repeat protein
VLAARIDRLTAVEKELLQQLSIIGRQFPVSLVKAVVSQTEDELQQILASLQAKEFLYEQPAFPESEYLFKHALTQNVAYGTVLQEQRKALHERTGQAMEGLYEKNREDHYRELAYHYSHSENTEKAVEYLALAGHQAVQRSANVEAVSHFTTAIGLLQTLPDSPKRSQQELALQVALDVPLMVTKSWAATEVGNIYRRARELCAEVGDTPELFPALWGLWAFYFSRTEFKQAHELGEQLLRLAQSPHDDALLLEAHYAMGLTLYYHGEPASARIHLEHGSALYDAQQHHDLAFIYGLDPGAGCLGIAAEALWQLGYPEQALKRSYEAVTLAQDLSHPFSLACALDYDARLCQLRRDEQTVHEKATAVVALSTEQGFTNW